MCATLDAMNPRGTLRIKRVVAVAAVLAAIATAMPATAEPYLLGVDVSHWDGTIDWTAVATDPQRVSFAVLKATSGEHSGDATYTTNRTGALTHGILIAAYHFAYPQPTSNDAVIQADHFVDVAQLAADRVIPALDIESTGLKFWRNITAAQLERWMRTWLDRVFARTGLRPMVYTSPSFWMSRVANTASIASAGYPLWIAHWGSVSPRIPAANWAGYGWRCWQYSDSGRVSGVPTAVDMDRLDPSALRSTAATLGF
ncbi:MAG: hypothetical protein NVSMB57_05550 [Actinomycetota bacterium]